MKLGTRTPLAARRWMPLLGACIALMLLGTQSSLGAPQGADKDSGAATPKKHDLTYSVENDGTSVAFRSELPLKRTATLNFVNNAGKKVKLHYAPEVFDEVEHLDADGKPLPTTSDGTTTLAPSESATLEVKKNAVAGSRSKIKYKVDDGGINTEGGADPIIIVKE